MCHGATGWGPTVGSIFLRVPAGEGRCPVGGSMYLLQCTKYVNTIFFQSTCGPEHQSSRYVMTIENPSNLRSRA